MRQAWEGSRVEVESPGASGAWEVQLLAQQLEGQLECLLSSKVPAKADAAGPQSPQEDTFLSSASLKVLTRVSQKIR